MLLLFIGPSGSGKSSVARLIAQRIGCKVWTGRDYLRLARSQDEAKKTFRDMLESASELETFSAGSIIYVIGNPDDLDDDLRAFPCYRCLRFNAVLSVLSRRFAQRMGQQPLPAALLSALERQRNRFAAFPADKEFDTTNADAASTASEVLDWCIGEAKGAQQVQR